MADAYDRLLKAELQALCEGRGLNAFGTKAELAARLADFDGPGVPADDKAEELPPEGAARQLPGGREWSVRYPLGPAGVLDAGTHERLLAECVATVSGLSGLTARGPRCAGTRTDATNGLVATYVVSVRPQPADSG